jgi:YD repeat-containing protein
MKISINNLSTIKNIILKPKYYLLGLSLLLNISFFAQTSSEIVDYIPMTPESYQFKKRLVSDVSMYTGQPNITIPIYTINLDGMEVPISISCLTGGITVQEEASTVGLGWMLNVGGEISRSNHGAPDEKTFITTSYNQYGIGIGYLKNEIVKTYPEALTNPYPYPSPANTDYDLRIGSYTQAILNSNPYIAYQDYKDCRPDEFFYSFFGHSGKFMYSQALSKFITFPLDDATINYTIENVQGSGQLFKKFTITLPTGFSVQLGEDGRRSVSNISGPLFNQAWMIKKIVSPKNNEIQYTYLPVSFGSCTKLQWERSTYNHSPADNIPPTPQSPPGPVITFGTCTDYVNYEGLISSIDFPEGRIDFSYTDRLDLSSGSKRLDEIRVLDKNNTVIKRIKFNQSYFIANFLHNTVSPGSLSDVDGKRLRLDSVEIYGNSSSTVPEKYSFDYNTFGLIPAKTTYAIDHWGYFTGRTGQNYIPPKYIPSCFICNKDVDTTYSKTFSINKITYPEGGVKVFEYENHKTDIRYGGFAVEGLFNEISDELYETLWFSSSISGYALNNYNPTPTLQPNTFYDRVLYSDPFEILLNDDFFTAGSQQNFFVSSDMASKIPNATLGNQAAFYVQKLTNGTYTPALSTSGLIVSNTQNVNGHSSTMTLTPGTYRFAIKLTQSYVNSSSVYTLFDPPNEQPHHSNISLKLRRKTKTEFTIGGLRIKEIDTYPQTDTTGVKYVTRYKYLNDQEISSGVVMSVPSYEENIAGMYYYNNNSTSSATRYTGYRVKSESTLPMIKTSGSNVGYTKVIKEDVNGDELIKTEYYFTFQGPRFSEMWQNDNQRESEPKEWQRGKLFKTLTYRGTDIVKEEINEYYGEDLEYDKGFVEEINTDLMDRTEDVYCEIGTISKYVKEPQNDWLSKYGVDNVTTIIGLANNTQKIPYFKIYTGFEKLKSTIVKTRFNNDVVEEKTEYFYPSLPGDLSLKSVKTKSSANEVLETKYYYPQDLPAEPWTPNLLAKNMLIPLITENYRGGSKLNATKKEFGDFSSLLLPKFSSASKGDLPFHTTSTSQYDADGNLIQFTPEAGTPTSLIWGYTNTKVVAKIEGLAYSSIPTGLVTAIKLASDGGNEATLRMALDSLRNNPALDGAMVTTYTFKPLVGVSTITDPKGVITYYSYDNEGRLNSIKDAGGKIVSENVYHYKN